MIAPSTSGRWASVLPHSRVRLVTGAGHFLDLEQPDELARTILEAHTTATEA